MFYTTIATVRNLLGCLHNNASVRQHVTYVSVISPTAVIARDLTGDYVQSKDESMWWLKPRVNRPARSVLINSDCYYQLLCTIMHAEVVLVELNASVRFSLFWILYVHLKCRANLMIRGSSAITEEVKYDYSYSLYRIHVPESWCSYQ